MGITIKDIANEAGVSTTTVSLVLNNKNCRVSNETRRRVKEIAERYSYMPNLSARTLVMRRSQIIGLILQNLGNPYYAEVAKGIESRAAELGYSVVFCDVGFNPEKELEVCRVFASRQMDGLIIISSVLGQDKTRAEEFHEFIQNSRIPVVLVDRRISGEKYDIVKTDRSYGAYLATSYLLDTGCKRVGFIAGMLDMAPDERFHGYERALTERGLAVDEGLVASFGEYTMAAGLENTLPLIKNGADCIFASNDVIACGVLKRLRQLGISPGKAFPVMGFDNIQLCEYLDISLSTINQPAFDMGARACELVIQRVEGKRTCAAEEISFTPSLVIRESTTQPDAQ